VGRWWWGIPSTCLAFKLFPVSLFAVLDLGIDAAYVLHIGGKGKDWEVVLSMHVFLVGTLFRQVMG
jgi:hypothetical protein